MKKGFTIVEVSILFVIFIIVAFLVAPLSVDDTLQAKHTSRWRVVQADFTNIFYSIKAQKQDESANFEDVFVSTINSEAKSEVKPYSISFLNGANAGILYKYEHFFTTYSNAVFAYLFFNEAKDGVLGHLMYDVNGVKGPNVWGKDVFGLNIYENTLEPIGSRNSVKEQKDDCSRKGTGMFCSNYYLIGGNFD
jgi:type II secretory pathway pseudopilin PulG